jgi:alpha-L-fucosidase 2
MSADLKIWFPQPAKVWMTDALPIGNGRIGGMVFGGIAQEHIQFNEDSLWTGKPAELAGNLPGGAEHIKEIQDLMAKGQIPAAEKLIQQYLYGNSRSNGAYQPFGDILIDEHSAADAAKATDYHRELDLETGVVRTHYTIDGVSYDREYFCSHPDHAMVVHFTCGKPGSLNLSLRLTSAQSGAKIAAAGDQLVLSGKLADNGLGYQAVLNVRATGGTTEAAGDQLQIKNADEVVVVLAAATEYAPKYPTYRGADPAATNAAGIGAVQSKSYADLLAAHEKDYTALFGRVSLDLGHNDAEKQPTNLRLAALHKGANDPALEALFFQFGRYLLISCSRDGLPSNRQGLWNDNAKAQSGADFPVMMNLEMMYFPVETTNLSECAGPLINMIDGLREPGSVAAKTVYGARGWIANYTTNPWGFTAAGNSTYQYFPAAAAWLCQHLWEHYAFTQDKAFLEKTAYPIMKEAAEFWVDHLVTDADGTLVSSPSESPEHGGFVVGAAMDQEIVWDLFTNCIDAANVLKTDDQFRDQLVEVRSRLSPPKIGKLGQFQEWKADLDDPKDNHRHVSQLFAVYPGRQVSPVTTPALADAAKVSLKFRGDSSLGWAIAWKIGFWARLQDGDHAHLVLANLMTPISDTTTRGQTGGTYGNLLAARPAFQIDGNLAATAAIAEMLLQSQNGDIHLLPALPKFWPAGSVKGLRARGGFEVDETWANNALTGATVHCLSSGVCRIRSDGPVTVSGVALRNPAQNVIEFDAAAGQSYAVSPVK